ncbi:MAG: hypothetical protein A2846_00095 [Candidatus Doudnabacteria bacterium RIFCSPHIGHO2_01_FULL_49_9]|uniref:DUF805 domain-containing protein n=1 Tax=Candidatus Doudnabacteria bacterium RIFCSPHIGHO2_01_FULL_49_9 TaxID=1817827 RepID=A0A1F5P1R2_9BACT|nr:MAG: hypothetical protein A2846_00095 [Candidatus Doudnabacteria bacterium RIFCSPHIGHO2_01_FULL_49_9]
MINIYIEVLKKYAVFSGRAGRREYWMFVLANLIVSFGLGIISGMLDMKILYQLYTLAVIIPSLAVAARRLHDTDRSGWWLFIGAIPFIGVLILIVFMAQESQPGMNQYGQGPMVSNMPIDNQPQQ